MKTKANTMDKALGNLLDYLCTDWGFCIGQESTDVIKNSKSITADEFACAVLEAEGMNSETEIEFRRRIRNLFIEKYGNELYEGDFNNTL